MSTPWVRFEPAQRMRQLPVCACEKYTRYPGPISMRSSIRPEPNERQSPGLPACNRSRRCITRARRTRSPKLSNQSVNGWRPPASRKMDSSTGGRRMIVAYKSRPSRPMKDAPTAHRHAAALCDLIREKCLHRTTGAVSGQTMRPGRLSYLRLPGCDAGPLSRSAGTPHPGPSQISRHPRSSDR